MLKIANMTSTMIVSCPPEVLIRSAVAKRTGVIPCLTSTRRRSHKAAVCTELGKPLQIRSDVPTPQTLEKGKVLVKVRAAGINFADVLVCAGLYQEKPPLPFIPGAEVSGQVAAIADGVTNVAVNDRVVACLQLNGFSEYCLVDSQAVWKIPEGLSYPKAASLITSYCTAFMALARTAQVKPGETILVTAAAGGLGLAAVDLGVNVFDCKGLLKPADLMHIELKENMQAINKKIVVKLQGNIKISNALVIGACGGEEKGLVVKEKGAHFVIDYTKESLRDQVKEITKGKGADVVIDAVGGQTFMDCIRSIAFEGRIVTLGYASGDIPKVPANHLLVKSCSVMGLYWGSYSVRHPAAFTHSIESVLRLAKDGKINPHVSKSFPLEQINEAFQFLQSRKSTGKVTLETSVN